MTGARFLRDPLLDEIGVEHGFGTRGAQPPDGCVRPRQVHGVVVASVDDAKTLSDDAADAVVCRVPGLPVAVVTADCVPILLASSSGRTVAAVHAGWRGLAAGIVSAAIGRLADLSGEPLSAAIGPHIRSCCYEVDAPVVDAMQRRFGAATRTALRSSRPGHDWIDLQFLVGLEFDRAGIATTRVGATRAHCTACDAERFESFRRDGPRAGRLIHWVAATSLPA